MSLSILRIDGSARRAGSVTRTLTDRVIDKMAPSQIVTRDLADGVPLIDEAWIGANFTPAAERSPDQVAKLEVSDAMVAELKAADTIVLGVPIYNFSVPAAVKAWIDQVARAGITFAYNAEGPKGLLEGKRAVLVIASGGTKVQSEIDFATDYMIHALGFIGIHDVELVFADRLMAEQHTAMAQATTQIDALAA
ncbi:MAG: FMN-dependent NADH-azoreductase [Shimia sp.]